MAARSSTKDRILPTASDALQNIRVEVTDAQTGTTTVEGIRPFALANTLVVEATR